MSWERIWYPDEPESLAQKLARLPLSLASLGFHAGAAARGALYDAGLLRAHRVPEARVISVGNLTVGGAGKTPVVIFLANRLAAAGHQVAVLSRGYGRSSKEPLAFDATSLPTPEAAGDEPLLIAQRCPRVRVYVGADRVERARAAAADGAKVLLLDDGMQHRRLARDVDVVVIDEAVGLGNGALLPRGPLREPAQALHRASLLWVRAAGRPASAGRTQTLSENREPTTENHPGPSTAKVLPPFAGPVLRAAHRPLTVLDPEGAPHPAQTLRERAVWALCALARPLSFARSLEALGAKVVGHTFAPDHHRWERPEVERALRDAAAAGAIVVTTEKDRVKLPRDVPVHVLRLEVELLSGAEHLEALLGSAPQPG